MEITRYHGHIVAIGDCQVKVLGLPDWVINYIEYPTGEMPEYRLALVRAKASIVKVTDTRIYFED